MDGGAVSGPLIFLSANDADNGRYLQAAIDIFAVANLYNQYQKNDVLYFINDKVVIARSDVYTVKSIGTLKLFHTEGTGTFGKFFDVDDHLPSNEGIQFGKTSPTSWFEFNAVGQSLIPTENP